MTIAITAELIFALIALALVTLSFAGSFRAARSNNRKVALDDLLVEANTTELR